jgi:septum formation protein
MTLVLASASSARRRMLEQAGVAHRCDPADIDEAAVKRGLEDRPAAEIALALAEAKARRVAARHPGALILGSDQMLECDGRLYDKPASAAEAREHLCSLRGRTHTLISAAVLLRDGETLWRGADTACLTMRPFTDTFLDAYLAQAGAEVLTTVGCYRIEGQGVQLFTAVEGSHFTILGLPLLPVLEALRTLGELPA